MQPLVEPIHYHLQIEPDLSNFRFRGQMTLQGHMHAPTDHLVLNVLQLALWQCKLAIDDQWHDCPFTVSPEAETVTIQLPDTIDGPWQLQIEYEGVINDLMAGFYRSQYPVGDGGSQPIAVTQFQESAARRAFPCIDHPGAKAVFDLEMVVDESLTAIANTPVLQTTSESGGKKRYVFASTPKMSTYLLFFGVGRFAFRQDDTDPRVRIVFPQGLEHTTDLGLDFGRRALKYCEAYYGSEYPLAKMDLIAVPDFAFGAMENWGAITFRENLLLQFPGITSRQATQRICEVIAHEIAHQWFGNLVTPSEWKYLWLNESFATYFGYGVVAHEHPDWGVWDQFLHGETATAMARDGLPGTCPIEMPGDQPIAINASTAPIIYNKGASILRMIEGFIGTPKYQDGVRQYLAAHAYGSAESQHLWQAFEKASDEPITDMMASWIHQPGHPLITAKHANGRLQLTQQRFSYLPDTTKSEWIVPVTIAFYKADASVEKKSLPMTDGSVEVRLPEDCHAYLVNAGRSGFFRVQYADDQNWERLGQMVRAGTLDPVDRWGLENDLYALTRSGRKGAGQYLDFLDNYAHEDRFLPLASMADHLHQLFLIGPDDIRKRAGRSGRQLVQRVLDAIGPVPATAELHTTAMLRNQLLGRSAVWENESMTAFATNLFQQWMDGQALPADIASAVMNVGAYTLKDKALKWLLHSLEKTPSEQERVNILSAMGAFPDWDLVATALTHALAQVPGRIRHLPILSACGNPACFSELWPWYQAHRQTLEGLHPILYERVLTAMIPVAGLDDADKVVDFMTTYRQKHPSLDGAIEMGLENLAINERLRNSPRQ